jgi:hypothetical protein
MEKKPAEAKTKAAGDDRETQESAEQADMGLLDRLLRKLVFSGPKPTISKPSTDR